jgi:translocation and assembly module TamB
LIKKLIKLFLFILVGIFLLPGLLLVGLQTDWAKEKICQQLFRTAQDAGMVLHIGALKGHPPFRWILEDVSLQIDDTTRLSFPRANMRIAILPLLRKQLKVNYLRVDDLIYENQATQATSHFALLAKGKIKGDNFAVYLKATDPSSSANYAELQIDKPTDEFRAEFTVKLDRTDSLRAFVPEVPEAAFMAQATLSGPWNREESPLEPLKIRLSAKIDHLKIPGRELLNRPWEFLGDFSLFTDRSLHLSEFSLMSNLLTLNAQGDLGAGGKLKEGDLSLNLPDLSRWTPLLQGSIQAETHYHGLTATAEFSGENLHFVEQPFERFLCQLKAEKAAETTWEGHVEFSAKNEETPIEGTISFALESLEQLIIRDLNLKSHGATVNGSLIAGCAPFKLENGAFFATVLELGHFAAFFPGSDLSGSLGAEFQVGSNQELQLHVALKDFHWFEMLAHELTAEFELIDYTQDIKGTLALEGSRIYLPQLYLSSLNAQVSAENEYWPFDIQLEGRWKEPLDIHTAGYWKRGSCANPLEKIKIQKLEGFLLQHSLDLEEPLSIRWSPERFEITPCHIQLGDGHCDTSVKLSPEYGHIRMQAKHFPLDLLTLLRPTFTLQGSSSLDIDLEGSKDQLHGHFNLVLEQAHVSQGAKDTPLKAKGTLQGNVENNILQVHAQLKASDYQFFEASATLPILFQLFPLKATFEEEGAISGEVIMEGKLEDIFDFVNIGSHRATGLLSCRLFLSKTIASPTILGSIDLQSGSYENYYTGTLLRNINAQIAAEKNTLTLTSLTARDNANGTCSAEGELLLKPKLKFPFSVQAELNNLNALRFDTISANFSGPLSFTGDANSALAKGELFVSHADLKIPDDLPIDLPVLPVTYVNEPPHLKKRAPIPTSFYPLRLDLDLTAPDKINVTGKGLTSEWKGDAHLKGTNAVVAATGSLQLIKGEFDFAGKTFMLTHGVITFVDKPSQGALLNLTGTLALADQSTVTASLHGHLTAPVLTFQSSPPQPTSSILAKILFDKDISEIDPFQAMQLAQTIVSMAGGSGPSVFDNIRKTLGIDRLCIVPGPNGLDDISLQIGKYLTHGVTITLTQGTDSSNVVVEVELCQGLIFQAETQEQEEGKFSLKWHRNY